MLNVIVLNVKTKANLAEGILKFHMFNVTLVTLANAL